MMNILLVDDDADILDCFKEQLELLGLNVKGCRDGIEALYYFEKFKYDLIITDIEMPLKNGIELIKDIRLTNEWIPIVVNSGSFKYSSQEILNCGANLLIQKSEFSSSLIIEKIANGLMHF